MIANLTNKTYIARQPFFARSFADRLRGMMGRRFREAGFDAMVFARCNNIHTLFMLERIDVIFLDADNKVVGLRENLARWCLWVRCSKALRTIELPAGVIKHSNTELGHIINVSEESVPELNQLETDERIIRELDTVVHFKESGK